MSGIKVESDHKEEVKESSIRGIIENFEKVDCGLLFVSLHVNNDRNGQIV